jgi:hypothetical protein
LDFGSADYNRRFGPFTLQVEVRFKAALPRKLNGSDSTTEIVENYGTSILIPLLRELKIVEHPFCSHC